MKGLFLHNPKDLHAKINGGVQICSQEYLKVIETMLKEVALFEVHFNKSFLFRFLHKLRLDNYLFYDVDDSAKELTQYIYDHNITHIFINKSELLRFTKVIKDEKRIAPKVIVCSHGNESGDLLGELTSPNSSRWLSRLLGSVKLGLNQFTESYYRKRYIDLICTMSDEEAAIEKWLGMNNVLVMPRTIENLVIEHTVRDTSTFGFVGTLDHGPNLHALLALFTRLKKENFRGKIRLVGGPIEAGEDLQKEFAFVTYLGKLSDRELEREARTWGFFINPIFYYSRGASMKLKRAIEWEIPTISTLAGQRGYSWKGGVTPITVENNTAEFTKQMIDCIDQSFNYEQALQNVKKLKENGITVHELATALHNKIIALSD